MLYKRILLKLSGELFGDPNKRGLDFELIGKLASVIHLIKQETNIEVVIVVGAGNLFRGRDISDTKIDRTTADYIGMLGTIMNALALQEEFEKLGEITRVMSAFVVQSVCEPFIRRKALRHLEKGRIVIIGGGTGNPFFTTDSAAALKACELKCEILLKGSNVDGVYSIDPKKDKKAKLYTQLNYQEALEKGLMVMDNTAFALCQREQIPIRIFNLNNLDNIRRIIKGEHIGTLIK